MVDVLDTFVCCNSNNDLYDTGAELFAGIRCVFNRNNLAFFSSFRGSNIGNSCICHFIFIFPGYNTNKFNDQLPVTWLADANWLEPCIGIAVRVNLGKPPIFSGFFCCNCISWDCNCAFVISMQLALDQHLVVPEEATFFMNMGQYKNLINYSHPARRPWISLNTSWSSSILASHQEPINALELSKYWELNHKLTIKFLN